MKTFITYSKPMQACFSGLYTLLFVLVLSLSTWSQNLSMSLTACYPLNGNGAETVNGLTGTLSAVTPTVDRFNNPNSAMRFAGNSGSYIMLPEDSKIKPNTNGLSISCWVRATTLHIPYFVFTKNSMSAWHEAYELCVAAEGNYPFMARKCSPSGINAAYATTSLSINTWYHLACTFDDNFVKIYVNGVLEGTGAITYNGYDYMIGKKVILGATNEAFDSPFQGSMDNLRFYNRALTAAEVTLLYNDDRSCEDFITGGNENTRTTDLNVYPNPVKDFVEIETNSLNSFSYTLQNIIGTSVLTSSSHNGSAKINTSDLPAGIYFITIETSEGKATKKIIKE